MGVNIETIFDLEKENKTKETIGLIEYIDDAFDRKHGDSFWINENDERADESVDVGAVWEWWRDCMRPELMRVLNK